MRIISLITISLFSLTVFAEGEPASRGPDAVKGNLPNFTVGNYKIAQGKDDHCRVDGKFKFYEDGKGVEFGVFHSFNTEVSSEVIASNLEDEKDCSYDARHNVELKGATTVLTFTENLRCKTGVRHTLTKTAQVTKDKITLDVKQEGQKGYEDTDPSFAYRCVWTLKK